MIAGLRELGKTVFLTTHYMDEAQALADRVAMIAARRDRRPRHPRGPRPTARASPATDHATASDGARGRRWRRTTPVATLNELTGWALARGLDLEGLEVSRPSLEDVYLELTGARDEQLGLVLHQFRFDQKVFWRNPASVFFTVMFPVILLLIFATVFGDQTVDVPAGSRRPTYYVPAIITLAVVSATMQSLAMSLVIAREDGRLKRGRGTPMPTWVFIAGRVGNSIVVALLMLVLIAALGRLALRRRDPLGARCRRSLVTLVVGAAAFCCLGIALTAAIPSQDAAAPIVNALLLPLYFLSGVFIPDDELPERRDPLRRRLPDPALLPGLLRRLRARRRRRPRLGQPRGRSPLWGVAGLLLAVRYFRWTPRGG